MAKVVTVREGREIVKDGREGQSRVIIKDEREERKESLPFTRLPTHQPKPGGGGLADGIILQGSKKRKFLRIVQVQESYRLQLSFF